MAPHAATGLLNSGKDWTCPLSSRYVGPTPHQEETQRTSRLDPSPSNTMYLGCMMFPWEQVRGTQTEHHIVPATNLPATTIHAPAACPAPHARHATQGNCGLSGRIKIKNIYIKNCVSLSQKGTIPKWVLWSQRVRV